VKLKRFGAKEGAWAVVTGASDGIGRAFAFQLAKAGFNVLLVARNQKLLDSTAAEIGTTGTWFIHTLYSLFPRFQRGNILECLLKLILSILQIVIMLHSETLLLCSENWKLASWVSVVGMFLWVHLPSRFIFLVNNVGKSHAIPAYFWHTPLEEINDIVAINVHATLGVTYAVLPGMVQR
jgi:NAD(P)-dependent dehydrogenase (short-subunit alcohol dehydrogenase family)